MIRSVLLVQAHEALRVSLSDLRAAETKGKWWLVGAAWGGDPLVDQQHAASTKQNKVDAQDVGNTALVQLARKQGMNTDIRRSVFVVLMSSDVRSTLIVLGDPFNVRSLRTIWMHANDWHSSTCRRYNNARSSVSFFIAVATCVAWSLRMHERALSPRALGKVVQPVLRPRLPATLRKVARLQNYASILPVGFPSGPG